MTEMEDFVEIEITDTWMKEHLKSAISKLRTDTKKFAQMRTDESVLDAQPENSVNILMYFAHDAAYRHLSEQAENLAGFLEEQLHNLEVHGDDHAQVTAAIAHHLAEIRESNAEGALEILASLKDMTNAETWEYVYEIVKAVRYAAFDDYCMQILNEIFVGDHIQQGFGA